MGYRPLKKYKGSCRCGSIRFEIETDFPELTSCGCEICRPRNALMVCLPETSFKLLRGMESLSLEQFQVHAAKHFYCKACGVYTFHRKRAAPDDIAINVRCLEGFDPVGIEVRTAEEAEAA